MDLPEVTIMRGPQAEVRLYRLFVANKLVLAPFAGIFENCRKSWLRYCFKRGYTNMHCKHSPWVCGAFI